MHTRRTPSTHQRSLTVLCTGNRHISSDRIGPRVYDLLYGRYDHRVSVVNTGAAGLALPEWHTLRKSRMKTLSKR